MAWGADKREYLRPVGIGGGGVRPIHSVARISGTSVHDAQLSRKKLENAVHVGHDVVVADANHAEPLALKPGGPPCVAFCGSLFAVVATVEFQDQLFPKTHEVHDIGANRVLSPESDAQAAQAPEVNPESGFRVSLATAKGSGRCYRLPLAHVCRPVRRDVRLLP